MQVSPHRLQERVAYLVRRRRWIKVEAATFALDFYRCHRRLPPGYVTVLLPIATVRRIRVQGELEHLLGLPALNRFSRVLWTRVIDRCRGTKDVGSHGVGSQGNQSSQ
ncbi:hypothetical protein XI08_18360 [Bradyrhizobium sp. CCBAU 11361]|nr:hypothetical protein [Bradyrhizobium sp. CCBAU 11361]